MFSPSSLLRTTRFVSSNRKVVLSILAVVTFAAVVWFSLQMVKSAPAGSTGLLLTTTPPLGHIPTVTLDVPDEVLINEPFKFNVTFTPGNTVGFGPFIDLVLP